MVPGADLALLRDDQEFAVGVADMLARHRLRSEQQMARHTGECLGVARRDGLQARHECELGLRNQHRRPAHWADWYRPSSYEGPLEAAGGNRGPLNYLAIGKRLAQLDWALRVGQRGRMSCLAFSSFCQTEYNCKLALYDGTANEKSHTLASKN